MQRALVDTWNDLVDDSDEVWILGDLIRAHLTLHLSDHVQRLKGQKILVPGEHDRCWRENGRRWLSIDEYLRVGGIGRIVHKPEPVVLAGERVRVSHFPYRSDTQDDVRFMEHYPQDNGDWLLHGHVLREWRQNGRQINVGVDAWGLAPVSEDRIREMILAGPAQASCSPYAVRSEGAANAQHRSH